MSTKVYAKECEIGRGLFAIKRIRAGEMVLAFGGDVLTPEQVRSMAERQGDAVQIGSRYYIDVQPPGLFTNHSCQPNTGVMNDTILVALRDINVDEELRFDYSTTMSEEEWTMQCRCGSAQCRGVIGDFHLLPKRVKRRYLALGIVQRFIVDEYYARIGATGFARARPSASTSLKVVRG